MTMSIIQIICPMMIVSQINIEIELQRVTKELNMVGEFLDSFPVKTCTRLLQNVTSI